MPNPRLCDPPTAIALAVTLAALAAHHWHTLRTLDHIQQAADFRHRLTLATNNHHPTQPNPLRAPLPGPLPNPMKSRR